VSSAEPASGPADRNPTELKLEGPAPASGPDTEATHSSSIPLKVEAVLMAAAMAAIALITGANVVTRYLTNISLAFTEEFSVALMVIATLLGTSFALARGHHIAIVYFVERLHLRGRVIAEIVGLGLVVISFGIIAAYGAWLTWDEYRFDVLSPGMELPQWWLTGWLPLLSLLVIVRGVERMVALARLVRS
jgi:TRAP-type C4-dicarboxylate transport system permease small subunit